MATDLRLIDVTALRDVTAGAVAAAGMAVAGEIDRACRDNGFFRITGHGIDPELLDRLDATARDFFARPDAEKAAIAMAGGGATWRGWFGVGDELTSGRPDRKEGIYFGTELAPDHPAVVARRPLHGPNLFPAEPAGLRDAVLAWVDAIRPPGARAGRLDRRAGRAGRLRRQHRRHARPHDRRTLPVDGSPGPQRHRRRPAVVAVLRRSVVGRPMRPMPLAGPALGDDASDRWDGTSIHARHGTYGEYLTAKVARVFPGLLERVNPQDSSRSILP